jgi:CRP-like cAMP-binding protein
MGVNHRTPGYAPHLEAEHFKNRILRLLEPDSIARLHLECVDLPSGTDIERPGDPIRHLVFIEDGVGSMTNTFRDGFQVEVGMFGVESVMGASVLVGTLKSLNKVYMQMSGYGYACSTAAAVQEYSRFGRFHDLVLRYLQAQFVQTCQSAGCNAHHELPQRLSRWLLLCSDRSENTTLKLTQEYLADMLGTRRSSVSLAAERLQREGLINYHRGRVMIADRQGLERRACECYRVVRDHLESYLEVEQN